MSANFNNNICYKHDICLTNTSIVYRSTLPFVLGRYSLTTDEHILSISLLFHNEGRDKAT